MGLIMGRRHNVNNPDSPISSSKEALDLNDDASSQQSVRETATPNSESEISLRRIDSPVHQRARE